MTPETAPSCAGIALPPGTNSPIASPSPHMQPLPSPTHRTRDVTVPLEHAVSVDVTGVVCGAAAGLQWGTAHRLVAQEPRLAGATLVGALGQGEQGERLEAAGGHGTGGWEAELTIVLVQTEFGSQPPLFPSLHSSMSVQTCRRDSHWKQGLCKVLGLGLPQGEAGTRVGSATPQLCSSSSLHWTWPCSAFPGEGREQAWAHPRRCHTPVPWYCPGLGGPSCPAPGVHCEMPGAAQSQQLMSPVQPWCPSLLQQQTPASSNTVPPDSLPPPPLSGVRAA